MTVAYLIPADLADNMDELGDHVRAGKFARELAELARSDPGAPGSVRPRIAAAVQGACAGQDFAAHADAVACALDRLDPAARAVAIFMLLPCAGDSLPRCETESDFAFVVRLLGSRDLVWDIAGAAGDPPALPGLCGLALDVTADPLVRARRLLDTVPAAAAELGKRFTRGSHPAAPLPGWFARIVLWRRPVVIPTGIEPVFQP